MSDPIRILVADEHPIVRRGFSFTLRDDPGLDLVGEAADGRQALDLIRSFAPDVALLDIDMPVLDGFAVARAMVADALPTRIIFMTLHNEEEMLHAALDAGARGYLLKDNAAEDVIAAIRAVMAGGIYIAPEMTAHLVHSRPGATPASSASVLTPAERALQSLTRSERRILTLIADGRSSKEIGDDLNIHYRTVENHRTNICRKLNIEGSNALLRFALQHKAAIS